MTQERYQEAAEAFGKFFDPEEPYPSKEDFKIAAEVLSKLASGKWKLVPAEPTPEMVKAARFYDKELPQTASTCYRAMIAAAPDTGGTT